MRHLIIILSVVNLLIVILFSSQITTKTTYYNAIVPIEASGRITDSLLNAMLNKIMTDTMKNSKQNKGLYVTSTGGANQNSIKFMPIGNCVIKSEYPIFNIFDKHKIKTKKQ